MSQKTFCIYAITCRFTNRQYVGITIRSPEARASAHWSESKRGEKRPNGLAAQMLSMRNRGLRLYDAFNVQIMEEFQSDSEFARAREFFWVNSLNTMSPAGFNLYKGGSSLGSAGNSKIIKMQFLDQLLTFNTIREAVGYFNETVHKHATKLCYQTVRNRIAANWSKYEALGLTPHFDRRKMRDRFVYDGKPQNSLDVVSSASGISKETLKSRLHRAIASGNPQHDLSQRLPHPKAHRVYLPHPTEPESGDIHSRQFSEITKIPQTTISNRAQIIINKGLNHDRNMFLYFLINGFDRSKNISIRLPDNTDFSGSINQLAKIACNHFDQFKLVTLKKSTIRKRLQYLFSENITPTSADIYRALGLIFLLY